MSCKEIKELLPAYLEKLVSGKEEDAISEHLARCPDCKALLEDMERANALVQTLEDVEPPPFLAQRIMADVKRLQQEKEEKAGFWKKIFYPLHIKMPIQALATVLIVVLAVQVYRTMEPAQVAETLPMQNQVMTPAETDNTKLEALAPSPAAPATPAAATPSVQKAERATVSGQPDQSLAKAKAAQEQRQAKADSAAPGKDAALKPAAEEPRMKNQAAPLRAQALPQVAEKSAPAGAMMEAYQAAPSPTAADKEESSRAVNADKAVARKAKKLSADAAPMGASVQTATVSVTLRASDPAAAISQIETWLNSLKKTFTKETHSGSTSFTATLSPNETAALIAKLKALGSMTPEVFQTQDKTVLRVEIRGMK